MDVLDKKNNFSPDHIIILNNQDLFNRGDRRSLSLAVDRSIVLGKNHKLKYPNYELYGFTF